MPIIWIGISLVILLFFLYIYLENNWIQPRYYSVSIRNLPENFKNCKIVHLSDLHLRRSLTKTEAVLKAVKKQRPSYIFITGDIVHYKVDIKHCGMKELCRGLQQIAPTYAVTGNHEYKCGVLQQWKDILNDAGIPLLDQQMQFLQKKDQRMVLLGLGNDIKYSDKIFPDVQYIQSVQHMPVLLLAHHTEYWPNYSSNEHNVGPDLVFCGHAHGGQWRIPFFGPVLAPGQGWLPKYTSGLYTAKNGKQMIVSRGLGNSRFPIRINNRPHLPVVTLQSKH